MIKSHNNRILSKEKTQDQPKCNCRQKDTCPLEGHCLGKELMYRCIFKENTASDGVKYNGLTENTFKDRFYKHRDSFKYESKANSTKLSKHFWEVKRKVIKKPIIHWSVIDHAKPYQNGSKRCNLCLTEKYHILTSPVNLIKKGPSSFQNAAMKPSFTSLTIKQSHQIISKAWVTIGSYGNMSNFIKNKCIWTMWKF